MKMTNLFHRLLLLLVCVGFLASCSEEEDATAQDSAPTLPSAAVFSVNLPKADAESGRYQSGKYENAFHALSNYYGWQIALELYLAHPTISFAAAIQQQPEYLKDEDRWVWSFNTDLEGNVYQVNLYGRKAGESAAWEMYVSQEDGFQDLLWLSGTSALDGTEGTWRIRTNTENPKDALQIEWEVSNGDIPYAKYTGLDKDSNVYLNYIEYGSLSEGSFNVFYNVYSNTADNLLKIEYNNQTKIGRVTDSAKFGDSLWHCWNSDYQDIDCQ